MPSSTLPQWATTAVKTDGAAPDQARMDTVELLVRDLDGMTDFYREAVTLDVLDQSGPVVTLGRGTNASVILRQESDLPEASGHGAGLYHTALLFEDQTRLAGALQSMAGRAGHLYQGSADHLVSEAFYFSDPEGNGLELYRDRPREQWPFGSDGSVRMTTEFLDPNEFLAKWYDPGAKDEGISATLGHVHLQVGDIAVARQFYEGALGFDVTASLGSALFLSAGGYHHHIGLNTWHSAGAGPRAAELGLGDVRIQVPRAEDVSELQDRLGFHGIKSRHDGQTLRFEDPWKTVIAVTATEQ